MNRQLFMMRYLWGSLLASTGVNAALLVFEVFPTASDPRPPQILPMAFAGLAVALAAASFVVPRIVYKQAIAKSEVRIEEERVPEVFGAGYRQAAPERRVFGDPEAAWREAAKCSLTPFILGCALSELIAMLGFVLGILGFAAAAWAPFMIAAAALIAIRFPTRGRVTAPFEAAHGASFPETGPKQ
jgi:hypothetical protein